jgi:hypothetical protein
MSALMASAGMLFGPTALPILSVVMAFLISALDGLLQLMDGFAGGMSSGVSGVGWGWGWGVQQFTEVFIPIPSL